MKKIKDIRIPIYNLAEELINSISHGIGAFFSILGLIFLINKAVNQGTLAVVTVIIFGTTIIILYTISCIYHALSSKCKIKQFLRIVDHCSVYLLVFGTIIPIALLSISSISGWIFLFCVAIVTVIGIVTSIIAIDRFQIFEVICHLVNGWSALIFSKCLITNIGVVGLVLIILGGVMYTVGAILYGIGTKIRYMHSIFHIFCLFGTFFHYLAIYLYVL